MTERTGAERAAAQRDVLSSPARRAIWERLCAASEPADSRGLTAADLAQDLHLHVTTGRFHLDQLIDADLVETNFVKGGIGRPRKTYRAILPSPHHPTPQKPYHVLAELLADSFLDASGASISPEEVGERWTDKHLANSTVPATATSVGQWIGKVGSAIDLLEAWGYHPELSTENGGTTAILELRDCPFMDLARANPAVLCGVHLGLIRGALRHVGENDVELSLKPFIEPACCLARLTNSQLQQKRLTELTDPVDASDSHPTSPSAKEAR